MTAVAVAANFALGALKGSTDRVVPLDTRRSGICEDITEVSFPFTVLARKNASLFKKAYEFSEADKPIFIIGWGDFRRRLQVKDALRFATCTLTFFAVGSVQPL